MKCCDKEMSRIENYDLSQMRWHAYQISSFHPPPLPTHSNILYKWSFSTKDSTLTGLAGPIKTLIKFKWKLSVLVPYFW